MFDSCTPAGGASSGHQPRLEQKRPGVHCERIHLLVEPDILHAPAVEDAVDHDRQALDIRALAGAAAAVENDRPHTAVGRPGRFCNSRRTDVGGSYALIAAISGLVPMMFRTRVIL